MVNPQSRCAVVTGGAGFIGSHLVDRLLQDGHRVRIIDNLSTGNTDNLKHVQEDPRVSVHLGDINDVDLVTEVFDGAEWVFHLAARADIVPSIQQPREYFEANVDGTFAVLEAARRNGVQRFVYSASSSCYGIPDAYPTPESAPIQPRYPYALTKRLGEELVLHWGQLYKLPVVSLRLFNVYGPRSRTSGTYGAVFGVFLAQKLANKPLTVVGDGTQSRDFTFVTDVVDAFVTAAESSVSDEIFNVGTGVAQSVNRLVELLNPNGVTYIPKRPGEPDITQADVSKIARVLHWKAKIDFERGVDEVLKNIDYWRKAVLWTPDTIADATKDWFRYIGDAR